MASFALSHEPSPLRQISDRPHFLRLGQQSHARNPWERIRVYGCDTGVNNIQKERESKLCCVVLGCVVWCGVVWCCVALRCVALCRVVLWWSGTARSQTLDADTYSSLVQRRKKVSTDSRDHNPTVSYLERMLRHAGSSVPRHPHSSPQ